MHADVMGCIGYALDGLLPGAVAHQQRQRSDMIVRLLMGRPPPRDESFIRALPSFDWIAPLHDLSGPLDSFWWSAVADDWHDYWLVDGVPTSPLMHGLHPAFPSDWIAFKDRYGLALPTFNGQERAENYLWVNDLLVSHNPAVKRACVFYDMSRLADASPRKVRMTATRRLMIDILAPLGWRMFTMPPDSPPAPGDPYWGHYDNDFLRAFFEGCIEEMERGEAIG